MIVKGNHRVQTIVGKGVLVDLEAGAMVGYFLWFKYSLCSWFAWPHRKWAVFVNSAYANFAKKKTSVVHR